MEPEALVFLPCVSAIIWSALELHRPAGFTQHPPDRWNWPPCTGNFHMSKQQAHMYSTETHTQAHWLRWQYVQAECVHITPESAWAGVCLLCMRQNSPRSSRLWPCDMDRWLCPCRNSGYVPRLFDNEATILNFADQWVIFAVAFLTEPNYLSCNQKTKSCSLQKKRI